MWIRRKKTSVAFLLWCVGCFGIFGLHRLYVGKIGTALLWMCTGGVCGLGALLDLFNLGGMVGGWNRDYELKIIRRNTCSWIR